MGTFTVALEIIGPRGRKVVSVQALADTGATHTLLPRDLLVELGIDPTERVPFQISDERTVEYEAGEARIRLTLELFNMAVDPMRRSLFAVPDLLRGAGPARRAA